MISQEGDKAHVKDTPEEDDQKAAVLDANKEAATAVQV